MDVALGIAGIYSCVPSVYKYFGPVDETRPIREVKQGWGWQCTAGVIAAMSAHRGFGGGHGILDGEQGYWAMVSSDRCDFDRLTAGLGEEWLSLETEFKLRSSIGANHPAYWATKGLVEDHDLGAEDVEEVTVTTLWAELIGDHAPVTAVDAQFSLPYTIATTIMREPPGAGLYREEKLADPAVRRLLGRIRVVRDPAADRAFFDGQRIVQTVEIALSDGRAVSRTIEFPRDQPEVGEPEVVAKFEELSAAVLSAERRAAVRTTLANLDELDHIGVLARLLC